MLFEIIKQKIYQFVLKYSQKNTCVLLSFYYKETPTKFFSCEYCENF